MLRELLLPCFLVVAGIACAWGQAVGGAPVTLRSVQTANGPRSYLEAASTAGEPAPVLVFLHGDERASRETLQGYYEQWADLIAAEGWHLLLPWTEGKFSFHSEEGLRSLRIVLQDFTSKHRVDARRVYLVGHGDGAPAVFAAISRMPDRWTAALAIGGDATHAIETNRLFAGNAAEIPLLWLYEENRAPVLRSAIRRLEVAGLKGRFEAASEFRVQQAVEWLREHQSPALPTTIDYETGSQEFRQSYWAEIHRFDFTQRNDVLASTRVNPGTGAFLRLGGFGYDPEGVGPGVPVKWLPPNYKGPLQLEDCIVSIGGKMLQDAAHYAEIMEGQRESRDVGIILLRKGKNLRIETRIVIPQREETETARIVAEYLPEGKEILVVTRGVGSALLNVPAAWAPVRLNWNGMDVVPGASAGCWLLEAEPDQHSVRKHGQTGSGPAARPVPCGSSPAEGGL